MTRVAVIGAAVATLLGVSLWRVTQRPTASARLQLVGAVGLSIVVLTHVAERLQLWPSMGWGQPQSVGHYADLASAVVAVTALTASVIWRGKRP